MKNKNKNKKIGRKWFFKTKLESLEKVKIQVKCGSLSQKSQFKKQKKSWKNATVWKSRNFK